MTYYRKKPVTIEALQWDGTWESMEAIEARWPEMRMARKDLHPPTKTVRHWSIATLESQHEVSPGDYIIKGVKGEFYPCKPDIFEMTYEAAEGKL